MSSTLVDRPGTGAWLLALASFMIASGGVLLGLQVDGNGDLVGTGFTALGFGALVAVVVGLAQASAKGGFPRDPMTALSAVTAFFGIAFIVSGVLAPGGSWMFFELFLLLVLLVRRRGRVGPEVKGSDLFLLGCMLVFRLWITYQGSAHRWEVLSVDVPVLSSMPFPWLDPVKTVSLGSFTPGEMGFPPTGLDFPLSLTLWSLGFALCAAGLYLRRVAAREYENDRIHVLIRTLHPALANLVERLLPEEDWEALGLHGLATRRLAKRVEALVTERILSLRQFHAAYESTGLAELTNPGGFTGQIVQALAAYDEPPELAPPRDGGRA